MDNNNQLKSNTTPSASDNNTKRQENLLKVASNVADGNTKVTHRVDIPKTDKVNPDTSVEVKDKDIADKINEAFGQRSQEVVDAEILHHDIVIEDDIDTNSPSIPDTVEAFDRNVESTITDESDLQPSFISRLGNIFDLSAFDVIPDNTRRMLTVVLGIIITIIILICCFYTYGLINRTSGVSTRTSSTISGSTQINTITSISEDTNIFSGLFGESSTTSVSAMSNTSSVTSEQIIYKKENIPYSERLMSDLVLDSTEEVLEKSGFKLNRLTKLTVNDFSLSNTNLTGTNVMNSYGMTDSIAAVYYGPCGGKNKCQINQIVSKISGSGSTFISDRDTNFLYEGCIVKELENKVYLTLGNSKLYEVLCYSSKKYYNNTSGFIVAKYTNRDAVGSLEFFGTKDLGFIRDITEEAVNKLK